MGRRKNTLSAEMVNSKSSHGKILNEANEITPPGWEQCAIHYPKLPGVDSLDVGSKMSMGEQGC